MSARDWKIGLTLPPFCTAVDCVAALRLQISISFGRWIDEAALAAAVIASYSRVPVNFEFNGFVLTAHPDQDARDVVALYWSKISNEPMPEDAPGARQEQETKP